MASGVSAVTLSMKKLVGNVIAADNSCCALSLATERPKRQSLQCGIGYVWCATSLSLANADSISIVADPWLVGRYPRQCLHSV